MNDTAVDATPTLEPTPALLELAHLHGVRTEYNGFDGSLRKVSTSTLVQVLTALGVPATNAAEVQVSLLRQRDEEWRNPLPPTVVTRQGVESTVPVHVTDGSSVDVWVEIDGSEPLVARRTQRDKRALLQVEYFVPPRSVDGRMIGRAIFAIPGDLPLGWHTLHLNSDGVENKTTLIVTPQRLELPPEVEAAQVWGLLVQLYSVRSRASWGLGDLADLADLAWLAARRGGADFIAVNPLAAAEPISPMTPSPYLPTSRRFLNPIYVRVEDIPETAYLNAADRSLVEWAADPVRHLNTDPGPIDRDAVWEAKKAALETVFTAPRRAARQAAFDDFVAEQGKGLLDFATWCAICEHLGTTPFPPELGSPDSPEVAALREQLATRVEFFKWLQWVADEQKATAQRVAKDAGMKIGVMHDLAVGAHPEGADAWANGPWMARGCEVGAPPDMYNQQGQNWSQPPWNPRALAKAGYAPYRDMMRTVLRSAGALRADHILGLFRLWWIPAGATADQGTYVTYDHEAMVGILCLEAHLAGAVVVGEDLGTFEPWVRDYLKDRGILGTSIIWFENSADGTPIPPAGYRSLAMASVGTHDMSPTAGYLAGEHVELAEQLGLLKEPVERAREREREARDRLINVLRQQGLIGAEPSEREIVEAMHRYLRQSPAALLGVQLVDMVGERRAQNQPGTDQEYPNWKVPLGDPNGTPLLIEDAFESQRLLSLIEALHD